ncbi:hypothetical protein Mapa_000415 [Marchantia paleacea]|nr:hypothetical protein Mapa_000415 [Marchantia paleacea]
MGAGCSCLRGAAATPGENKTSADGKIKTVVLLVMENRSFDNMLGFLLRDFKSEYPGVVPGSQTALDFLQGDEFNLIPDPKDQKQTVKVPITDNASYITKADPLTDSHPSEGRYTEQTPVQDQLR